MNEELDQLLLHIPNIPLQDVPSGVDESGNVLLKDRWDGTNLRISA